MKRLLSLIVALSMLISLIPVVSATETTESYEPAGIKITYDLAGYLNDAALGAEVTNDGFKTIDYINSNGFFEFAAANYGVAAYSWLDNEYTYLTEKPNAGFEIKTGGLQLVGKRTPWFALKINVPKRGLYTPKVNYIKYNKSYETYMEYYLIKATDDPVSTTLAEEGLTTLHSGYIGSKRCESNTGKQENIKDESFDDKTIPLEKGEYYLVYYPRDPVSGSNAMAGNFTLDGGEKAVPMGIKISGQEALDLDATVHLSDGTTDSNVTWSVKAGDEATATIDADGKITALSDGTVEITATAEAEGVSVSKAVSVAVTVTPGSGDGDGGNTGDGDGSDDDDNTDDDDDDDDDVVLTDIEIVYDISSYVGTRNDESVPFSSLDYKKTHDFWAYAANRRSTYSWDSGRDNITTSGEDLNWVRGKGIAIRDRSNWWAIKIKVPESGYYKPKAYYGTYKNGGFKVDMNYYTLPVTASGVSVDLADSAFATKENLIGSINCTNKDVEDVTMCDAPAEFKARYFEKGEHYIVFYPSCTDEEKSGTLRGLVSDFILDGGEKAVPMGIEISGEEALDLDATVHLSDGTTIKDVAYKSENEAIATINANGVITVFENETVGITVSAENDGYSISKTFDIAVKKPEIPGVSVTYDIAS